VRVYAIPSTWLAMRPCLGKLSHDLIRYIEVGQTFYLNDIGIRPFATPHDAVCPVGYNLFIEGKKLTIATDIGHMDNELLSHLVESDMVLLESNHDVEMLIPGRYPWPLKQRILSDNGHLCNDIAGQVVAYLAQKGTRKFLLGHLSKENNFPELAYKTVCNALMEKKISPMKDVYVEVALRDKASNVLYI